MAKPRSKDRASPGPGRDPGRKPGQGKTRAPAAKRTAAGAPARGAGRGQSAPAAWVLRCAPGLARTLQAELRHAKLLGRNDRADLLWQRNHDLIFAPRLARPPQAHELRLAEELHHCLIYGRYKLSDSQLARLAQQLKGERRRLVVTADGRHFNRFDLARFLGRELARRGVRIDETAQAPLFVFCVEQAYYACVPARGADEATGRSARAAERAGSLPPTIAAAMAFLARPQADDTVLDPVCGSGTLLAEAGAYAPEARLIGADLDPKAVKAARHNLQHLPQVQLGPGDARSLELPEASVTLALGNLPFGKQFGDAVENRDLYGEILGELRRLAAPAGFRAVLIASDAGLLRASAEAAGFVVARELAVKVRGEPATIALLQRAADT